MYGGKTLMTEFPATIGLSSSTGEVPNGLLQKLLTSLLDITGCSMRCESASQSHMFH